MARLVRILRTLTLVAPSVLASTTLTLAPVIATDAYAQASATTVAIDGAVADSSGAALPGVTVTASSPALQGQRSAVTNGEGVYRLPQLPPGEYRIAYEMPGFATIVREHQQLAVGFNATINIAMQVSTVQETVTVSGQSPVVDQKASKIVTNFDAEKLNNMPSSRDVWAILAQAPAVQLQRIDVGGSNAGTQTGYSAYDTKADQHRPMVEGIVMTEGTNAAGFYYDYGSFAEVSVGTGSHGAEMGWPGVASSFISKSGGNEYHGRFYGDYQSGDVQSSNIDAAQAARLTTGGGLEKTDLNRMVRYYDLNADAGGYLKKDAIWWYGSVRDQQIDTRYPNFPVKPFVTRLTNYTGKGTYTLSQNNKFVGYGQWGRKQQPNRLDYYTTASTAAQHVSADSTWNQQYWGHVWKGEWNTVVRNSTFLEFRYGQFGYVWPNYRNAETPSYQDLGNNQVRGANRDWQQDITRDQFHTSASFFKDGWLGSHNFKVGGEVFREVITQYRGSNSSDGSVFPNNVLHQLRNGAPVQVILFAGPTESINGLWTYGGYINDTWQPASRLTLNLGLRLERYRGFLPAQERVASTFFPEALSYEAKDDVFTWNLLSPRVGVNYDLTGDGKTLLKFNYGQYWWNPGTGLAGNVNENPADAFRQYAWTDPNGDGVWQNGEQGALIATAGGRASASIDPNLEDTFTREFAVWVDRELLPNFGVRSGVVYRRIDQQYQTYNQNRPYEGFSVPITVTDPGPDGSLTAAADNGASYTLYNLAPDYVGLPTQDYVTNGDGVSEFWTWEVSGTKRMSDKWSVLASFAYRWNHDFANAYLGNNLRASTLPVSPNDLINNDEGRYDFNNWTFKASGSYEAPWDIRLSPSYRFQAGQPFGRTFLATTNYGQQRILAEPLDTQAQRNFNLIDVRVEKSLSIGRRKVGLVLDIYNLTNSNAEQNINWASGTTYLAPSNIIGPRIVRFGGRFDW
jgi:hypothetical protein